MTVMWLKCVSRLLPHLCECYVTRCEGPGNEDMWSVFDSVPYVLIIDQNTYKYITPTVLVSSCSNRATNRFLYPLDKGFILELKICASFGQVIFCLVSCSFRRAVIYQEYLWTSVWSIAKNTQDDKFP